MCIILIVIPNYNPETEHLWGQLSIYDHYDNYSYDNPRLTYHSKAIISKKIYKRQKTLFWFELSIYSHINTY